MTYKEAISQLETLKKNCNIEALDFAIEIIKANNPDDWFGEVRWCDFDIANELECMSYPNTPEAVALVKKDLGEPFVDWIIETGFEYIDGVIHNHRVELLKLFDET